MTLWREDSSWEYHCFDPDLDPGVLPRFADLIRMWQKKRAGRPIPARRDFDFFDFVGWHANMAIYELSYDPFDWRVRLSGTALDDLYERTMTGVTRNELGKIAVERNLSDQFDEMICSQGLVGYTIGPLNLKSRSHRYVEFLELPCSADGTRADHTFEFFLPLKAR